MLAGGGRERGWPCGGLRASKEVTHHLSLGTSGRQEGAGEWRECVPQPRGLIVGLQQCQAVVVIQFAVSARTARPSKSAKGGDHRPPASWMESPDSSRSGWVKEKCGAHTRGDCLLLCAGPFRLRAQVI